MIQNPISIEAATAISASLLTKLNQTTGYIGAVAGGFLRDAYCGKVAKDVDVYVSTPAGLTEEQLDEKAKAFYDALGHEFHLHKKVEGAPIAPPPRRGRRRLFEAENDNGGYPMVLRVYSSTKQPEDHYPVDLVMTPVNMFHPFMFDMNICNIHVAANGRLYASQSFKKDLEDKTITINLLDDPIAQEMRNWQPLGEGEVFDRSYTRLVNHIARVKAKYEDHRLVVSSDFIQQPDGVLTFNRLIEEGIIGDPRTFFQAKRQEPVGDEVRLEDGAEAVPAPPTREARRRAAIDALLAAQPTWPFGNMEAGTGQLFGGTQVQPRPDVIVYDEAEE